MIDYFHSVQYWDSHNNSTDGGCIELAAVGGLYL